MKPGTRIEVLRPHWRAGARGAVVTDWNQPEDMTTGAYQYAMVEVLLDGDSETTVVRRAHLRREGVSS